MKKNKIIISLFIMCAGFNLFCQEALKSVEEEYYDYLYLKGTVERPVLGYRTLSDSLWLPAQVTESVKDNLWQNNNLGTTFTLFSSDSSRSNFFINGFKRGINLKVYGPELYNSYNTRSPYGQNDGALWQGRGYNGSFTAGVRLEGYGFELTLRPNINFSQNLPFEIMPLNKKDYEDRNNNKYYEYDKNSYFASGIDLVQRYGDKPFWTFNWGDSEVRYTWYNFTMGFGTQNYWLGPAYLNPMLGSNNAAGFPKFDIGLRKTDIIIPYFGWNLGTIEGRIFTGMISESKYFDNNPDNNKTMITGMTVAYSPSFINGLTIGANRVFLTEWKWENLKYLLNLFKPNGGGNNNEDQKVSAFIDWVFPKVGFEVYGELGLDDFTSDIIANPFHTAVYTIGFKQIINLPHEKLDSMIIGEWNNFEMSQDFQMQWQYGGYYVHWNMIHGYTNNGQIIGAGSGAMGNSQFLGYKLFYPKGTSMVFLHRYCPNNNYIYNMTIGNADVAGSALYEKYYAAFETHIVFGITTDFFATDSLLLNGAFVLDHIHNVNYEYEHNDFNFNFQLGAKYNF